MLQSDNLPKVFLFLHVILLRSKSVPTITSSITYRGPLFPLIELIPLIDIVALEPGSPLLLITLTPAALPWSILETLDVGWFVSSSADTCDIEDCVPF